MSEVLPQPGPPDETPRDEGDRGTEREQTLPLSEAAALRASGWSRAAAAALDVAVLLLLPGLPRLFAAMAQRTSASVPGQRWTWAGIGLAALFLVVQGVLAAARGRTLGRYVVGIAVAEIDGKTPGFSHGLWRRSLLPGACAFALGALAWKPAARVLGEYGGAFGTLLRDFPLFAVLVCGTAGVLLWTLADRLSTLLPGARSFGDRLSGTIVAVRGGEERRAFAPPSFSGAGFVLAMIGLAVSGALFAGAKLFFTRVVPVEATELDLPSLLASGFAVLALAAFGALAAFRSKRFLVGEMALLALLAACGAFELMALELVRVPALQRFDVAGWKNWVLYAVAGYAVLVVVLVIGSALGFMVAGDDGADGSLSFEWLVARRHLRLRMRHYLLLAGIALIIPVVVWGVVVWPLLATWRLMRRRPIPAPLPPTVFMALLTVVGVMVGVMALVVVLSVMGGFERDLKEKILGTNAHGVIHRYVGDFVEWRDVARRVAGVTGVTGVTPFIMSEVMITTDSSVSGSVLKGIDVDTVGRVTDLARNIDPDAGRLSDLAYPDRIPRGPPPLSPRDLAFEKEGAAGRTDGGSPPGDTAPPPKGDVAAVKDTEGPVLPGIVVGREMARALRVWVGDKVTVMNPLGELGPQGPVPKSRVFRVGAIFYSGMYEYDSKFAYIQLREAQRFFHMGDAVTGL